MRQFRLVQVWRSWWRDIPLVMVVVWLVLAAVGRNQIVIAVANCEEIKCDKSDDNFLSCNLGKQNCWREKIDDARSSASSLKSTISILNGQISLQQLQIDQTLAEIKILEGEITTLTAAISNLSLSLDNLTKLLMARVTEQYRESRSSVGPLQVILTQSFGQVLSKLQYLAETQQQTVKAMQLTESQRLVFDEQKQLKEKKQTELAEKKAKLIAQEKQLEKQKADKNYLLNRAEADEVKFQNELAKTLAEAEAIQSIIAGKGNETKVGDVGEGDRIASIIVGDSPCSTGTHLHFEITRDGYQLNPATFLKQVGIDWRTHSTDEHFSFSGDWNWPLNNPATITQGFGMTYYARTGAYNGHQHTGIDMVSKSSDLTVKAVKSGTLYRGSYLGSCKSGPLKYVKVEQADNMSTYYLHVNY